MFLTNESKCHLLKLVHTCTMYKNKKVNFTNISTLNTSFKYTFILALHSKWPVCSRRMQLTWLTFTSSHNFPIHIRQYHIYNLRFSRMFFIFFFPSFYGTAYSQIYHFTLGSQAFESFALKKIPSPVPVQERRRCINT